MPIARAIYAEWGDYVLSLKGNQTRLHDGIRTFILDARAYAFRSITHTTAEAVDGDHSRNEVRRARATDDLSRLADRRRYLGLRSVLQLDRERIVGTPSTREPRSFVSSLAPDAAHLAEILRICWATENGLHWVPDVAKNQNRTSIRSSRAPENLGILNHIALSFLMQDQAETPGIKKTRLAAGWDQTSASTRARSTRGDCPAAAVPPMMMCADDRMSSARSAAFREGLTP
jgi:predicted transposase YbfD/YdcC